MQLWMKPTLSATFSVLIGALVALSPSPVLAVVQITFYSHNGNGLYFPHAFVTLHGVDDRTGRPVDLSWFHHPACRSARSVRSSDRHA